MLSMKIPAEIQEYKSKLIFGLSARQFFSIAGAILVGVPIGVLGHGRISADILPWFVIIAVMPFIAFGFFTFKGMRFEELVKALCNMWLTPQIRVYEDADGIFQQLHEEIIEEEIIRQRLKNGEYFRKDDAD
ncbi:MAG: PrgI family protein [Oscillospiraceae bacterium]|nr:PrgI family protein [Oscillospiraceae bacterium]